MESRKDWETIRRDTLSACGNCCVACGARTEGLQCHEQWHYDDDHGVATLAAFVISCRHCHAAEHMGRATVKGFGDAALNHFCRVNGCDRAEAECLFDEAKEN